MTLEEIAGAMEERPSLRRRWRNAWAPALAGATLLVVFLTLGRPSPPIPGESGADQALLSAVHCSIHAEVPAALRPAALLIADVERGVRQADGGSTVQKGEQP
jgi:hypothetical protein